MSYSVAITRVPVTSLGVWKRGKTVSTLVPGTSTLNVVNGRLNSISVKDRVTGKVTNVKVSQVESLSLPGAQDRLVFAAFTR